MADRKQKSFSYRYAEGLLNGRTLQAVLEPVLYGTHRFVDNRAEDIVDEHGNQLRRCINLRHRNDDMLFGEFILYVSGTNKQVVTVQQQQEHLRVDQIQPPPDPEGNPREFIDAVLYFGIHDNHVVVVQSAALRDRDFESHLNWLLFTHAQALQQGESIMLRKELTLDAQRQMDSVRSVSISAPLIERRADPAAVGVERENQHLAVNVRGRGLEWLRTTVGVDLIDNLNVEDLVAADELEVHISIVKKGGSRLPDSPANNTIAALTQTLRHQYEDDIRVTTRRGEIRGRSLFLRTIRTVNCLNGVPNQLHVFEQMSDWLSECLELGHIRP